MLSVFPVSGGHLSELGLNPLNSLGSAQPVQRYENELPGDLVGSKISELVQSQRPEKMQAG